MNVLSLFDGISCGQIALNRLGIKYDNYYASEIDKSAIKVTQYNFPNTIQLGDIRNVHAKDLPKIDLILAGSPCQDLSQGNNNRQGLKGAKSGLFFEFARLLKECKPKYFLLENVVMALENNLIITSNVGVYPVAINSKLLSAQSRDRLYWTNIPGDDITLFGNQISQPKDKGISLQSILDHGYTDMEKSRCILATGGGIGYKNMDLLYRRYSEIGFVNIVFDSPDFNYKKGIRNLSQNEIEQLQTLPKGYTKILTKPKEYYSAIGNGWTIDVICHILKNIK